MIGKGIFRRDRLARDIGALLVLKVLLLAVLWFVFVHGREVNVDTERAAALLAAPNGQIPTRGVADGQ